MLSSLFARTLRSTQAPTRTAAAFSRFQVFRAYSDEANAEQTPSSEPSQPEQPRRLKREEQTGIFPPEFRKPQHLPRTLAHDTLLVKNIGVDVDAERLGDYFKKLAPIKDVRVIYKNGSHQRRGYVQFYDDVIPKKIVDEVENEPIYMGLEPLKVQIATQRRNPEKNRKLMFAKIPLEEQKKNRTIIVKDLPTNVTQQDLYSCLSKFGQILQVRLPVTADGAPRRFAFIMFVNVDDAAHAMEAAYGDGLWIENFRIQAMFDQSTDPNTPPSPLYKSNVDPSKPPTEYA